MTDISDKERARIAANVAAVKEQAPEAIDFIKSFHAEGLIEGWRDVRYVGPPREPVGQVVNVDDMMLTGGEVLKIKGRKR